MARFIPAGLALVLAFALVVAGCGDGLVSNASTDEASRHKEAPTTQKGEEGGTVVNATTHPDLYDAVFAAAHEALGSAGHSYTISIPEGIAVTDTIEVGYADSDKVKYHRFIRREGSWQKDALLHSFSHEELRTEEAREVLASLGARPNQSAKNELEEDYQIASLNLEQDSDVPCETDFIAYLHSDNEHVCHSDDDNRAVSYEFTDPSPIRTAAYYYDFNITFNSWRVHAIEEGHETQTSSSAECPFEDVNCERVTIGFSSRVANPDPPQTPELLRPEDGATLSNADNIHLQWKPSLGSPPITYEVQVSTTSDFSNVVLEKPHPGVSANDHTADMWVDLDYNETYYWRVRALNEEYDYPPSPWSNESPTNQKPSFSTGNPPTQVSISGPLYLDEGEMGTWTASPSGGNGSYTFDWELRMSHSAPWSNVCGNSSSCTWGIDQISETKNPTIRVTVTSGGTSARASRSFVVNNNGGGDDPGCDNFALGDERITESGEEIESDKICP